MSAYKVECKKIALFASKNFKKFFSNSLLRTDWRMEIERDWSRPPVRICEHIFFSHQTLCTYIIETPGSNPC